MKLLYLLSLPLLSYAVDFVGRIAVNEVLPNTNLLEIDTKVVLDGGAQATYVQPDGSFTLYNVPDGTYILSVLSRTYAFPHFSITVSQGDSIQVASFNPAAVYVPPHPAQLISYPFFVIHASGLLKFHPDPKSFNPIKVITGNPMMLLMIGGAAFVFVMPKLMENIDPEALKEIQQNQAEMQKNMASFQNVDVTSGISNFLSGSSSDAFDTSVASSARDASSSHGKPSKRRR